ncbi:MAG: YceI protein, partial [Dehalococcoidia bacterium]|nr:YceI protein [Dehalococcoidia bacterium]
FALAETPQVPEGFKNGDTVFATITGVLTLGAKEIPLTLEGEARFDGQRIHLEGKTSFTWIELGLRPPNIAGIVQVDDTVNVKVLIVGEPAA